MFHLEPGTTPLVPVPDHYLPEGAEPKWYQIPEGKDQGKRLFFYDITVGDGAPDATFLFVHGNPESSLTYRGIIDQFIAETKRPIRIVAMDHIGFGLSDTADFEMVDMHHSENLTQLVKELDLNDITLVIHDWGGAIGTGAFLDMPDRVTGLALMNTTVFPMPSTGLVYPRFPVPIILGWTWLGRILPDFLWPWIPPMVMFSPGNQRDFVFRHVPNFFWRAVTGRLTELEKTYLTMFRPPQNARASRRHVKQTAVWGHGYSYHDKKHGQQSNHHFYQRLQNELIPGWAERAIPATAFFGVWDPCGKAEVQLQWLEALPQLSGKMHRFPGVGHFVEEHRPVEIASAIMEMKNLGGK